MLVSRRILLVGRQGYPELLSNGSFAADTAGWLASGTATLAWATDNGAGAAEVTINGAGGGIVRNQTVSTVVGQTYRFSARMRRGTYVGNMNLTADVGANASVTLTDSYQDFSIDYVAGDDTPSVMITRATVATGTVYIDQVSFRRIA